MNPKTENPYAALERIFHEPNRLAIMSALCSSAHGLSFNELKDECALTDGNLSRHLKALEEARVIRIEKSLSGSRPKTIIHLSETGRKSFLDYLKALEEVLKKAAQAITPEKQSISIPWGKIAKA